MDELAWETTGTEVDYACPGFDVRRDDVRFPDGRAGEFHYVDEPPAVVILPFTPEGEVVVIEEWRQAVGRVNRGLPAGGVEAEDVDGAPASNADDGDPVPNPDDADRGPDPADLASAAARELAEETGYEAETFDPLTAVEPSNGIANSVHHHFVARGCEPSAEQNLDHNESIRVATTDYDDLLASVVDGELRDGRTVVSVLRYELAH